MSRTATGVLISINARLIGNPSSHLYPFFVPMSGYASNRPSSTSSRMGFANRTTPVRAVFAPLARVADVAVMADIRWQTSHRCRLPLGPPCRSTEFATHRG